MWIGFALGISIMATGIVFENEKTILGFMIGGFVVVAIALVQAFIFYTCPYCGNSLMDIRGEIPKHCPECGKSLEKQ